MPDLDEAEAFLTRHFGAITSFATGRVEADEAFMVRRLGVPATCRIEDIRVLRFGSGTYLELFR